MKLRMPNLKLVQPEAPVEPAVVSQPVQEARPPRTTVNLIRMIEDHGPGQLDDIAEQIDYHSRKIVELEERRTRIAAVMEACIKRPE